MKNAALYARKIKRLFATLKRDRTSPATVPVEDPLEQFMRGVLSRTASESRAAAALSRLRSAAVDLNDLRVTPVSEMVVIIGVDYPHSRSVADALSRVLQAIFYRRHDLDLGFLMSGGRRPAELFLNDLDGGDPHATATVILGSLGGHAIPVDDNMLAFLQRGQYVAERASRAEIQGFLERQIKAKDGPTFYALLKRYAATHTARPPASSRSAAGRGQAVKKTPPATKAKPTASARSAAVARRRPAGRYSSPPAEKVAGGPKRKPAAAKTRAAKSGTAKTAARSNVRRKR